MSVRYFLIRGEEVERHPEGMLTLAVKNGFGDPHVQFHPSAIVEMQEAPGAKGDVVAFPT